MQRFFTILGVTLLTLSYQNCAPPVHSTQVTQSSVGFSTPARFSELDSQIFKPKCLSCHSSGATNLTSYTTLMSGSTVVAGNPNASLLYQRVIDNSMPVGGMPLSETERAAMSSWIAAGALSDSALPATPPAAPTALAATAPSPTSVVLVWSYPTPSEVAGAQIERGAALSGPFTTLASLTSPLTTFTDSTALPANTYYYRVRSSNLNGNSAYSNITNVTTPDFPPLAPTNLVATALSQTEIRLNWTDNATDETDYKVDRATAANGPFTTIATLPVNTTTYNATGLLASTTYYFRVYAVKTNLNSAFSNTANVATLAPPATPPLAPSGLVATPASASQINLAWNDNSNDELGFKVERSLAIGGPFALVATLAANIRTFSDTGLAAATTYYYRVYAYNAVGNSTATVVVNAATQAAAATPPTAPTGLVATATSTTQINLNWTDNSNNESGFKLERAAAAGGPYTLIATLGANIVTYSNTALTSSTTYYYRVYAYNEAGNSATSPVANATTLALAPAAPSQLVAAGTSTTQINLNWTDNSNNETGFKVERAAAAGGPYTTIATLGADITAYTNTGLSVATTYYYRVFAFNAGGNSATTSVASAYTFATYTWLNTNIYVPLCVGCHTSGNAKGGYDMSTYTMVKTRVVVNNSANSLLYQRVIDGSMPKSSPLTAAQMNAIKSWIDSGAINN